MIKAQIINLYFSRLLWRYVIHTFLPICLTSFLINLIDAYNESFSYNILDNWELFLLACYRTPDNILTILPLIILIATITYCIHLGKTQQFIIAQQTKLPLTHIIFMPTILIGILSILSITIFNPLAAKLLEKREQFEKQRYNKTSLLNVADTGIWLKQSLQDTNIIIHASQWQHDTQSFIDISIWEYYNNNFLQRIEAKTADVRNNHWNLNTVSVYNPFDDNRHIASMQIETFIDQDTINNSFTSAATISIWQLKKFINAIENAGLNPKQHIAHYHFLLSQPIIIVSMFLLGIGICHQINNCHSTSWRVLCTLIIGIGYFVFLNIFQSIGLFHNWSVILSIWLPTALFLASVVTYILIQDSAREI